MKTCPTSACVWVASLAILAFTALAASAPASAKDVSQKVKRACANDYFAHCSMHPVGTPAVRKCMRAVGSRLSKPCIGALVADGEVTRADRRKYKNSKKKYARR